MQAKSQNDFAILDVRLCLLTIVGVAVGRLTHGSASQYLALCGGMTVLSSPASPVGL